MRTQLTSLLIAAVLLVTACTGTSESPPPAGTGAASPPASTGGASAPPPGSTEPTTPGTPEPPASPGETPGETAGPSPSESGAPSQAPTGFTPRAFRLALERVVDGLAQPVFLSHAGDGTGVLYIVEREGRVLVLEADGRLRDAPLLDIRDRVDTENERGLHAVAFHPDFERNGRFIVHYNDRSGDTILEEFQSDAGARVDAGSGRRVLHVDQPYPNHNGGWLGFGPDGYLYLALGDGGGNSPGDPFGNGQKRSDLLGDVLRLDVDDERPYGIPQDNPYAGAGGGRRGEIWAYGLRNPWRASFDRETGDLWIGDVGQDALEEIDVVPAGRSGLNFGWSDMEGDRCHNKPSCDPSDYVLPVAVYGTDSRDGCSVSGGYVYRGTEYPALVGGYLYSDFCSGRIWGFDAAGALATGSADVRRLFDSDLNIVSFGEDEAGELFVVDLGGSIHRVTAPARP